MKKVLILISLLLVLSACSSSNIDIEKVSNKVIDKMLYDTKTAVPNMNKPYYRYYLPTDVGRLNSTQLSEVFIKKDTKIVMNFITNDVIIEEYYTDKEAKQTDEIKIDKNDSSYIHIIKEYEVKNEDKKLKLDLMIVELNDDEIVIKLVMDHVSFYSKMKKVELKNNLSSMISIGKSVKFDKTKILNDYSLKTSVDSVSKEFDFTKQEIPESGMVQDIIDKD